MYKKTVLLTRCYQAQANTEERPQHDALLCFDRSDLWSRWFVIYWSETDSTHRVKKKLDKRQACISFGYEQKYCLLACCVNWLWCNNIQMFNMCKLQKQNKTKQNKMCLSCHKREKNIQNMSHRKKNSSGPKNIDWNTFLIENKEDSLNCFSLFHLFNDYLLRALYV